MSTRPRIRDNWSASKVSPGGTAQMTRTFRIRDKREAETVEAGKSEAYAQFFRFNV